MGFRGIFDVFSKRNTPPGRSIYTVPETLRRKIVLLCRDVFSNSSSNWGGSDHTQEFWNEIHRMLLYRHGKFRLIEDGYTRSASEDAINFLLSCKDEEFLDFIEYIFKVSSLFHVQTDENAIVADINELFASDSVGYELTEMVKERTVEPAKEFPFGGREMTVIKVVSYPRVIRNDNQVIHEVILKPVLNLLADPKYKTANQEYLEALEDYRKGDYGDCLTKCGSAFESVMKLICENKRWSYKQSDTAGTLISTIIKNANLDSFFDQPLLLIATLRNRLSKSHGSGAQPRRVSQNIAQYALSSTAAAILFLVNETK